MRLNVSWSNTSIVLTIFLLTSIYLYCGYHYWAFLGTWSQYLYYISRYVQVVYLSTNSLLVFISEEFYVLSYPHLRILGEGPLQRVTLYVSLCSINIVMSLLCLWSHVPFCLLWRCDFYNILEEHGCHFWFNSWWSIRVDPCSIY